MMHSGTARGAADILIVEFDSDLYYINAHPFLTARLPHSLIAWRPLLLSGQAKF